MVKNLVEKYLQIIHKRIWIVALISLVVSAAATFFNYFASDALYEAKFSVYVANRPFTSQSAAGYEDLLTSYRLAQTYSELAKSHLITDETVKRLELPGLSSRGLREKIEIRLSGDTSVLHLSVWNRNGENARQIAYTLYDVMKDKALELTGSQELFIINPIHVAGPLSPGRLLLVILISLLGISLSIGISIFMDYLDESIKTPEDVDTYLGTPVLGTIPDFRL